MKKKIINVKNGNGLYTKKSTKEKTPEDGFVYENKERFTISSWENKNNHHLWHKGYAKKISYTTNDPRITRPFTYTVSLLFLVIGIISLISRSWLWGILFTACGLIVFFDSKKDIDAIEMEYRKQGHDMDSKEKKQEVRKEFNEEVKKGAMDLKTSLFTKNNFKWFLKMSIPIYCIIAIITSLFFMIAVHIFVGIIILLLLTVFGLFYYYIISKLFK